MYRYRYDAEFKKMTPVTKHATSIIYIDNRCFSRAIRSRAHGFDKEEVPLYMFTASYYSMWCAHDTHSCCCALYIL
jgi:hypothetical protein